jgi:hypothetical protein
MAIQILASVLIVVVLILLFLAGKTLLSSGWFVKWLKGMLGIVALSTAVFGTVFAFDLFTYSNSKEGEVIATLKFNQLSSQEYEVEFVGVKGLAKLYRLKGDLWQLDVRLIHTLAMFGGGLPSYKIERLSGRYLSLEEEKGRERSVYGFVDSPLVDTWPWLYGQSWVPMIKASQGSAAYMPMVDGAIYQVALTQQGLKALPVNNQAKVSAESW